MIGTIGSLVQETSTRWRWLMATGLYTVGCVSTSLLLGALLGTLGYLVRRVVYSTSHYVPHAWLGTGLVLVGLLAVAYAVSDVGWIRLPRPHVMHAVPVTWWRRWKPYGAALAYGAALGVGLTTYISFGAYYVLCAWCVLQGNPGYGAMLMGTYGAARALVLIPASWGVYCHHTASECHRAVSDGRIDRLAANFERARSISAATLMAFGALVILSALT